MFKQITNYDSHCTYNAGNLLNFHEKGGKIGRTFFNADNRMAGQIGGEQPFGPSLQHQTEGRTLAASLDSGRAPLSSFSPCEPNPPPGLDQHSQPGRPGPVNTNEIQANVDLIHRMI